MKVLQIPTGSLMTNAYVAYKEGASEAFVVDPGAEASRIIEKYEAKGIKTVTHILVTHGHFDHIGAVAELKYHTGAKVCIHRRDASMLQSNQDSLAVMAGAFIEKCKPDVIFEGGETIQAAGIDVTVLHTPGHSGGSVCYLAGDAMFSGDTLFYRSVGRTDFPGSNHDELLRSLDVLRSLDKDYVVYPGHGFKTTLFSEIAENPFLAK